MQVLFPGRSHLPSTRRFLDTRFVSPGRGLGIRQLMGWTKVCETARSGIWVPKGNARTRMYPANLDHLRVGWRKQGTYETTWVTPGHDCLCSYAHGHGVAVRPKTNDPIWRGVIGLWVRVALLFSPWCAQGEVPTGVNLNRYAVLGSHITWHCDELLFFFGPQHEFRLFCGVPGSSCAACCSLHDSVGPW